ncbi:FCD domain-containing protein [Mesorhizobium sp. M0977]|uniref:FCD domain-containing protein n=1 Tax=Mesorhizobium sp. M0977 TaxID=2957039 RepID=UPI00333D73BA
MAETIIAYIRANVTAAHDAQAEVMAGLRPEMEAVGVESLKIVELDFQFHLAIAQATANPLYIYIVKPLRETIKKSIEIGRLRQRFPRRSRRSTTSIGKFSAR